MQTGAEARTHCAHSGIIVAMPSSRALRAQRAAVARARKEGAAHGALRLAAQIPLHTAHVLLV